MTTHTERTARSVKSAERTLRILETLAAAEGPVPVAALHREAGIPRSSLHQLVHTMAASGWVEFAGDGSVAIGSRALVVGTSYLDRDPALPMAVETLESLRESTGYTTHYARREQAHVLYLATRETSDSHRATSRVGRRLPAHATALGKALLSELSPDELGEALGDAPLEALTDATITDRQLLGERLEETRRARFAVEREENTPGVCCVAATNGYRIPATDAISCSIPVSRATDAELERVSGLVVAAADALGSRLRAAGVR
ncbi:IclR family transcriptional regulator [Myceligenerans pegani]|uniref:IclR family transcriptional regulator n=1 Tax=Myceligenerans pegani TaxID=2776917 RepID=UPI00299E648E|nr:IclR family transcriptional regulator [Myceligenerans sp. TRM 65318]